MRLILSLSLRNLLRQKRRNLFLGTAICFGMMIFVVVTSFAHGISDTLLNRMVVYITGHMSVTVMEDSNKNRLIIRDKDRFIRIIRKNVKDIKNVSEAVGVFARVIGNAKGDNAIIVGAEVDKEFADYLGQNLTQGSIKDFTGGKFENPVIIYSDKAKLLGVKYRDTINVRMRTITGQAQTARLTVAAVIRSSNMFEGMAMFVRLNDLKNFYGLRPQETGELQINFNRINDPSLAIREADKLRKLLVPGVAVIHGSLSRGKKSGPATALGLADDAKSLALIEKHITLVKGAMPGASTEEGTLVSKTLAAELALKPGDAYTLRYPDKFDNETTEKKYTVSGVFHSDAMPDRGIVLMNEKTFYKTYLQNLPSATLEGGGLYVPDKKSALYPALSPEWKLMPRSTTNDELKTKLAGMTRTKWKGPWLDVRTMYESADFVLKLEQALNLIALVAILILFLIILIGVLNTLRMTIRERTREIGTIRAIGMQKSDVKRLFITETLLLTAFACIGGILLSFVVMLILGSIPITTDSILSILLVNRRLYFYPSVKFIAANFLLIMMMAALTSYFPARRASNYSAVRALRHFE